MRQRGRRCSATTPRRPYVTFAPLVDPQTGLSDQAPTGSTTTLSAASAARHGRPDARRPGAIRAATAYSGPARQSATGATTQPLTVALTGNKLDGQPGHQRHRRDHQHRGPGRRGRSTPTRTVATVVEASASAARAPPPASSCPSAVVAAAATCCSAPPTVQRGPQDQYMPPRSATASASRRTRRSACTSTARSTAARSPPRASASRPMSRLVQQLRDRRRGRRRYVDNLDIFILPFINADGAHARDLRLATRRTNLAQLVRGHRQVPGATTPTRPSATAGAST